MISLVFAAGGTGGHVIPAINMADFITSKAPHWKIIFIGRENSFEERLIAGKYQFYGLPLNRSADLKSKKFLSSVKKSIDILNEIKPDLLIVFGSYITVPVLISAVVKRYSFWLHEQNVIPGRVTKLFAPLSTGVAVTFSDTKKYLGDSSKIFVTGNFIKTELLTLDKENCKKELGFQTDRKLLLITGGSQGAMRINMVVKEIIPQLLANGWQILHQIGEKNYVEFVKDIPIEEWVNKGYNPVPFIKNMEIAIRASDLAISRAGATTISQFLVAGLPAIYIPYPYAKDNHQRYNAEFVVKRGGGEIIFENDLYPDLLFQRIMNWDDNKLLEASSACISISNPYGREYFWNLILETLEGRN
jgi:UDP-N-acetylglucosamine--N-acetylmuramyl-(pentapeptide) pyrophosphoryl-undecaprenol N-acetylglucosamine transferase